MISPEPSGLLAPVPACFAGCKHIVALQPTFRRQLFLLTNRGLLIRLKITLWSPDTHLAYLDYAEQPEPSISAGAVRLGVFLRRLSEDDQYARVSLNAIDLFRDYERSYEAEWRPSQERQIFVRKFVDQEREKHRHVNRIYGYHIPSWIP